MKFFLPSGAMRRSLVLSAIAAAALCAALPASAQDKFPSRPIKLIVATTAGGNNDVLARTIADKLTAAWGQAVVVEQKVGANGMIATAATTKAAPDGYTIYLGLSSIVQNLLLQPNPGYRIEELQPVTQAVSIPIAWAVGGAVPANNVAELLKLAKDKPGAVSYGSYGTGSGAHIIGVALARAANVQMTHVPYKGEAASFSDLVSGQLTTAFGSIGFYSAQLGTGKVRLLAVTGPQRLKRFPTVPTLAEAGYPSANLPGWAGFFLPAGTPAPIAAMYATEIRKVLAQPDIQNKLLDMGFEPVGNSSEEFSQYIKSEMTNWGTVIKQNNIKLD